MEKQTREDPLLAANRSNIKKDRTGLHFCGFLPLYRLICVLERRRRPAYIQLAPGRMGAAAHAKGCSPSATVSS